MEQLRRFKANRPVPSIAAIRHSLADAYFAEHDTTGRVVILHLDEDDYDAVQRCIAKRQAMRVWPKVITEYTDGTEDVGEPLSAGSNLAGLAVAEICRSWEELH